MHRHNETNDRDALKESLMVIVREREQDMRVAGLNPTRDEVLDAVWVSFIRGKTAALRKGVDEGQLERRVLIIFDLLEEMRAQNAPACERGEGEIEFLKAMAPLITNGIGKRVRRQLAETGEASKLRAIAEEEADALANVDALRRLSGYSAQDVERRKDFLRTYFRSLRRTEEGC